MTTETTTNRDVNAKTISLLEANLLKFKFSKQTRNDYAEYVKVSRRLVEELSKSV